jgi:hypothetical protein
MPALCVAYCATRCEEQDVRHSNHIHESGDLDLGL